MRRHQACSLTFAFGSGCFKSTHYLAFPPTGHRRYHRGIVRLMFALLPFDGLFRLSQAMFY